MPLSPDTRVVIPDQQVFTALESEAVSLGMRDLVRVVRGSDADLP